MEGCKMDLQSGVQIGDLTDIHHNAVGSLKFVSWSITNLH